MRILQLTPELPLETAGTGGMTRQFHLLSHLRDLGHEITIVAPVRAGREHEVEALRGAGFAVHGVRRSRSSLGEFVSGIARDPGLAARGVTDPLIAWKMEFFWVRMRAVVSELLAAQPPDVILVEHDWAAAWVRELPPQIPTVLVFHNVSGVYNRDRARLHAGPLRAALRIESRRFDRYDARHADRCTAVIAVSEEDRTRVEQLTRVPGHVVPNAVACDVFRPRPEADGPPTLVFTGTMNYPPNADAARWLASEIFPRVRRALPDARLLLVGRDPTAAVRRLDRLDGVTVTGRVPSVLPYFEQATVAVVPVRCGSGTRLKALEAFAAGRAVVSTTVGIEGLSVQPGRHALVADDAGSIASAVIDLAHDPARRAELTRAARALVEERYDWASAGAAFAAVLEDVLARRAPVRA